MLHKAGLTDPGGSQEDGRSDRPRKDQESDDVSHYDCDGHADAFVLADVVDKSREDRSACVDVSDFAATCLREAILLEPGANQRDD